MATTQVTFRATADGKPLEVLQDLVRKRAAALKETTRDAVIATAINILNSLKAATKKAPLVGKPGMYIVKEYSGSVGGWEWSGGKYHRVARIGNARGSVNRELTRKCRNLVGPAFVKGEISKIYEAELLNKSMKKEYYYAFAQNEGQMRQYIEKVILARLLKKESGMAKYTIGIAQAKISTRGSGVVRPSGAKQWKLAHEAATVRLMNAGFDSGSFGLSFFDKLNYSLAALKGGEAAFNTACMKAANKTAGLIHMAFVNKRFGEDVASPFPEVKSRK